MDNKTKYLQIFNYLLEFSKIRSKPVRDIQNSEKYLDIIWLSDIPVSEKIECITHDDFSNENSYWLKIYRPNEPEKPIFPAPPENLRKWIIPESLLNKDELPELQIKIEDHNNNIQKIEDHPEIKVGFEDYCENQWFNDSNRYWKEKELYDQKYKIYDPINSLYKRLFSIYNKSQQLGEEYELVIGVGLINFKENSETPLICRHVISSKADIQFEPSKQSNIVVSQSFGEDLKIETDAILDLSKQFDSNDIIEGEKLAKDKINTNELVNPFDHNIHEVLQSLAERIKPGDGKYKENLSRSKEIPAKETIFYAPALIFRKRDTRSYTSMYEKIIEEIKESPEPKIPTLDDIISETDQSNLNISESQGNNENINVDDTIYFPKKYNDEQIRIIKEARLNNKVLVQGPPGTGKSHTIANLISHLLARGKKVLVTAYTKRALEVLKNKLPEEFKSLTVNLLSGDSSSILDLESSVNTINRKLSETDVPSLKREIEDLEKELSDLKEKRAFDTNELLKIKEKSTRRFNINPQYYGTLTEIAASLDSEKKKFDWYTDDFDDYNDNELIDKIASYLVKYKCHSQVNESIYGFDLPDFKCLIDIDSFQRYKKTRQIISQNDLSRDSVNIIRTKNLENLKTVLADLLSICKNIETIYSIQKSRIIKDLLNNDQSKWTERIERSETILKELQNINLRDKDKNVEIAYPKNKSLIVLKNDAKVLLDFLNSGNTLCGIGFKIKKTFFANEIKEKLYFVENVFVNGSPCDTIKEFKYVIEDLTIKQNLQELSNVLQIDEQINSYEKAFNDFQKFVSQTKKLITNIEEAVNKIRIIESISEIKIPDLNPDTIKSILNNVYNAEALLKKDMYAKKIEESISQLSKSNIHPICKDIVCALQDLNLERYKILIEKLNELYKDFNEYNAYRELESELKKTFPHLINMVSEGKFSEDQIPDLKQAFLFKNAFNELARLLNSDLENELREKLKSYDSKEESLIANIAAKRSWVFVLDKLGANWFIRRHLEAWVLAVKKIGKTGKGKRALKVRRMAQEEMQYCKEVVPCWIMPLYKVTETIMPEQGIYDYAIIDEASQVGPDALFLLYISKNIIIVGDDKQTSPEYVGVDADTMTPYINRYLNDIPFKNFYGTEFSFFDHAKQFCKGRIVLREHFRCMPEIIEFSNKLFYAPEGNELFPLKQYSENRLEPLMHYYCQDGFVEGQGSNIRNEPEAIAIVDKIYDVIMDGRYSGKSIGVICLQGKAQGSLIETLLTKKIDGKEIKDRKIICGNSASFQGDERDIIFLSLVTANNHNRSALTKPEDERRFNVAVSRAIEQVWLFHSILLNDLGNHSDLRYKILDHFINYKLTTPSLSTPIERTIGNQPSPFDSWFEVDVFNDIIYKGYSVKPQYKVANGKYRIDMVTFFHDGTKIAIECDGDKWHGADKYQDDILRQKVLERCGWQFFRIRGSEYYFDKEKSLAPLWKIFQEHDISKNCSMEHLGVVEDKNRTTGILNIDNENEKVPEKLKEICNNNSNGSDLFEHQDEIVRYFNLYDSGFYIMSKEKDPEAEYSLPIKASQKNGYLLQCYESGHVNKVYVSILLSRKIGKEYMNGFNTKDILKNLMIIKKEEILGIYYSENGIRNFKAHYTSNISSREQLHLQGYKVAYQNFSDITYCILPIEIYNDICRLVYRSFNSCGKPVNNSYYAKEWEEIDKYKTLENNLEFVATENYSENLNNVEKDMQLSSIVTIIIIMLLSIIKQVPLIF